MIFQRLFLELSILLSIESIISPGSSPALSALLHGIMLSGSSIIYTHSELLSQSSEATPGEFGI